MDDVRELGIMWFAGFYNKMLVEWRRSILVFIFKSKDVQFYKCEYYRDIKFISYSIKIGEKVIEKINKK